MSGAICGTCFNSTNDATVPRCDKPNCPGRETFAPVVLTPNIIAALSRCDKCDNGIQHDWIFCAWCGWQLVDAVAPASPREEWSGERGTRANPTPNVDPNTWPFSTPPKHPASPRAEGEWQPNAHSRIEQSVRDGG